MAVFRVDKTKDYTVMSNHHLRNSSLTMKAKGLLSLMLSLPDNWDYTLVGLSTISADGLSSIRAAVNELEDAGYLKRKRLRNEKGQLTETEYTILEQPESHDSLKEQPTLEKPTLEKPMLEKPTLEKPTLENRTQLNTKESNTELLNKDLSNINLSIPPEPTRIAASYKSNKIDMMDEMESYRKIIHESIEYPLLVEQYSSERIDELVQFMLDVICSRNSTIRIDRGDYPREVVKSRLLKLKHPHITYVLECMSKNTSKIHNIRGYLLTALYHSLTTIDSYYQVAVNHDMYGNG